MSAQWQPTGEHKGQFCSLADKLVATWCWPTFTRGPERTLTYALQ